MGVLNSALIGSKTGTPVVPTTGSGTVMYAYRTDSTTINPNGIRLTDGASLSNNMLIVSQDPVYIQGNFNTTNERGAVIMGDAINLLSNQWNDSMTSTSSLPVPTAPLNINAAMMTGAYATVPPGTSGTYPNGLYNGGMENFPRFHEDWSTAGSNNSNNAVNINGSFVSLFTSQYAQAPWVYGSESATVGGKTYNWNTYTAPIRNWNFDPNLLKSSFQPPGFPLSIGETRVVWWLGRTVAPITGTTIWTTYWPLSAGTAPQ
jgi:hypothetical protein